MPYTPPDTHALKHPAPSPQPALLLRSGISCRGNVGAHLRLHPAFGVIGLFDNKSQQCGEGDPGAVSMFKVGRGALRLSTLHACLC